MEDVRYQRFVDHVILEQLGKGKRITMRVLGKSMYPLIREGDPIQVEQCKPRDLSIGDIITFKRDDIYVTHRVLWIIRRRDGITLVTKGDNEITVDRPVSPGQILGKVVALERADRIIHFETPSWRFLNRSLGMISLGEAISILLYRLAVSKIIPLKTGVHTILKPPHLYRHFKNRSLRLAMRIIT